MDRVRPSTSGLRGELRVAPWPVTFALLTVGVALTIRAQTHPSLASWSSLSNLAVLTFAVAAADAVLLLRWPQVGTWAAALTPIAIVVAAYRWTGVPASLALLFIPALLTAGLIGLRAAWLVGVVVTALILSLSPGPGLSLTSADQEIALFVVWSGILIITGAYLPVYQLAEWLERYLDDAQARLEEARDRRAELGQALSDLGHTSRQLLLANERTAMLRSIAEEAQEAKTRFVARVSHEFRTPLNMITGLVELMVDAPHMFDVKLSPKMREDLEVVQRNCEHLSRMVNDVLDLTRIEADRMVLHRERVNLAQVVEDAAAAVSPLLHNKGLKLDITLSEDLPAVYCDRTRIQQVVLNLLSNAARYTERGGITVTVTRRDGRAVVSVADTGPGIAQRDAERIFEPFCQGTTDIWRDRGGSGLGLSISKQFIELHGGHIGLETELGAGTTFTFDLPIDPPVGHLAPAGRHIREEWVWREQHVPRSLPGDLQRARFVVYDPADDLPGALSRQTEDVEFVPASDFGEVKTALRESPAHAVVINVTPGDDLWGLLDMGRDRFPGTPIVACSVPRTVERAVSLGARGHLVKPVTRAEIARVLQEAGRPVKRVLLVDDDDAILGLFERMLQLHDPELQIVRASNGESALANLRRAPFDLMLLDVVMPDTDGWSVLETMAQDGIIDRVATYVVSAQDPADQPTLSRMITATIDDGLPMRALLRCLLSVSALLLRLEAPIDPASG
ncbi:MAG: response regulator [Chloroflexi bacterium]|nr:response regulator [Chloroflexota bacterium]